MLLVRQPTQLQAGVEAKTGPSGTLSRVNVGYSWLSHFDQKKPVEVRPLTHLGLARFDIKTVVRLDSFVVGNRAGQSSSDGQQDDVLNRRAVKGIPNIGKGSLERSKQAL